MQFRRASVNELEAVMAIIEDGRASLGRLGIDQWQNGSPNASMVRADMAAESTMVAEQDGQLLGTLAFVTTGEADYAHPTAGSWLSEQLDEPRKCAADTGSATDLPSELAAACDYVTLHRVAVAANATGHGVASFMMQKSIELAKAKGFHSVRVDTHEGNTPMQRMLEKNGFAYCCDIELSSPSELTKKRLGYELLLS